MNPVKVSVGQGDRTRGTLATLSAQLIICGQWPRRIIDQTDLIQSDEHVHDLVSEDPSGSPALAVGCCASPDRVLDDRHELPAASAGHVLLQRLRPVVLGRHRDELLQLHHPDAGELVRQLRAAGKVILDLLRPHVLASDIADHLQNSVSNILPIRNFHQLIRIGKMRAEQ